MSPFRTLAETAAYLRLSRSVVYRLARRGAIPSRKHAGKIVFLQADLDAYSNTRIQAVEPTASLSRFEQARLRVRSLTTQHTDSHRPLQKGTG